jgi:hypothetical protein
MRKALAALTVVVLAMSPLQASAAVKAGAACTKAGATSTVGGIKYTCVKSGKKLVWDKGVKVVAAAKPSVTPTASPTPTPTPTPTPSPTPVATPTPTPTPTPTKTFNSLWEKYDLTKPTSAEIVIKTATDNFKSYTSTIRNADQEVKVVAQTGVDPTLISWVKDGATYVARHFTYPKLSRTFVDFIAIDKTWLEASYIAEGYSANFAKDSANNFCGGAPACGGSTTNLWNYSAIQKTNALVNDKVGMAQTPGHEFFHAIQEMLAAPNLAGPTGEKVPNWFWEGPAQFVGLQTASALGYSDYTTLGRPSNITRYKNGNPINRTSNLSEIKANNGVVDPYAIGFAASEFLVAQVGVEKMVNVYAALGQGKTFDVAFKQGTGIELADFYSMFEEVRATLGFAKS